MQWFFPALTFGLGAIIGSFLNVVIYRYPRGQSVVFPASRCPHCGTAIKPYDNVPVLAWLWLLGRCRTCRGGISVRYPLIELANGLFYLALFHRTGATLTFLLVAATVSMTIALIFIDLEIQILPDAIDLPGIGAGLAIGAIGAGASVTELTLSFSLVDSIAGALLGGGVLLAISLAYRVIRKVEGMGLGDVKMLAMLGAILGWEPLLMLLVLASVCGALVGGLVAARSPDGMKVALPFGVFLGLAFLVVLFFGADLAEAYLHLVGGTIPP